MKKPPAPGGTADNIAQVQNLFREVCSIASTGIDLLHETSDEEEDIDDLHRRIRIQRFLLERIGWVADVGLRQLGDSGSFAGAEDWMLPGLRSRAEH